jgi:hypothetical protein
MGNHWFDNTGSQTGRTHPGQTSCMQVVTVE